jgi:DNA-binding NarL/FixJ family response regulator
LAEAGSTEATRTVAILADDLIWSTRLADAVRAAGAEARVLRRLDDLSSRHAADVIVDLTARAYDGIEAIRLAAGAGARVVAVGQHDDAALRKAALEAGASRVFTYRALFEDGARLLGRWLAG